jgi:uncharacterized protein (UPF0332 family)
MDKKEIKDDLKRAFVALEAAERNLNESDILTAANRNFVACENAVYIILKSHFGSTSISRIKIATKLTEINKEYKQIYDISYDLRVQADYGKQQRLLPLTKDNLSKSLEQVKQLVLSAQKLLEQNKSI